MLIYDEDHIQNKMKFNFLNYIEKGDFSKPFETKLLSPNDITLVLRDKGWEENVNKDTTHELKYWFYYGKNNIELCITGDGYYSGIKVSKEE